MAGVVKIQNPSKEMERAREEKLYRSLIQIYSNYTLSMINHLLFGEQSGKISYAVKLMYIGKAGNKTNITTNIVLNDEGTDIDKVNRFILNSYENANTILYLPEDMVISAKVICYNPAVNKVYNQVTLPKGFYSVPNDTDLLEIVYDEKKHAEFLSYKTEFTKSALEELGIKLF